MTREIPLIHPGEILLEDWLKPLGISQTALAKAIAVRPRRIHEIIAGKRAISADTALRLAAFFQTDAQSWLNLQSGTDAGKTCGNAGAYSCIRYACLVGKYLNDGKIKAGFLPAFFFPFFSFSFSPPDRRRLAPPA